MSDRTPKRQAEKVGDHLQTAADSLSQARIDYADVLEAKILAGDYRSWALAGEVAKVCLTDFIDGVLARLGARIAGRKTRAEGSRLDGDADKALHRKSLGALGIRSAQDGEMMYSNSLNRSQEINEARDERVSEFRDEVAGLNEELPEEQHITTRAVRKGQAKTWVNNIALVVAVSPITEHGPGRAVAAALYSAGDHLAIQSEQDLRANVAAQMGALGIEQTVQTT